MINSEYDIVLEALLNKNSNPKWGLFRIQNLLKLLSFDESWFKMVQIIGTNGKGSTAAFLESILLKQNLRVGKFISPHLTCARERFVINGEMVSEEDFVFSGRHILDLALKMDEAPSFFECVLAMALLIFKKYNIDVVILEAGLGGRLDATTACNAHVLGITTIDLDHQSILGPSLKEITYEKLSAARSDQEVLMAFGQKQEVKDEAFLIAKDNNFKIKEASLATSPLGLLGHHQAINAGLSIALAKKLGYLPCEDIVKEALVSTRWPGRMEVFSGKCPIVLDGAHNESGVISLVNTLKSDVRFKNKNCLLIFGATLGHDVEKMIKSLLTLENIFYILVYQSQNKRAFLKENLLKLFLDSKPVGHFKNLESSEEMAYSKEGYILICGSLYAVGEIRAKLVPMSMDPIKPTF